MVCVDIYTFDAIVLMQKQPVLCAACSKNAGKCNDFVEIRQNKTSFGIILCSRFLFFFLGETKYFGKSSHVSVGLG